MSEVYRGGKVPKSLDRATRRLLEDHDRMLVRGIPVGDTTVIVQGKSDVRIPASPVRYVKTTLSGNFTNIPIARAGTVLVMAFNGGPTLKSTGGNLHLSGDFTPQSSDETITLVSDGVFWREMSRGVTGWQAFIPVGSWGAKPDVAADMSTRINEAFDECPLGATLYFPTGTYTVSNPVVCDRSINIWAEGAISTFSGFFFSPFSWGLQSSNLAFPYLAPRRPCRGTDRRLGHSGRHTPQDG